MAKTYRKFTDQEKAEAISLAAATNAHSASTELGIPYTTLYTWMKTEKPIDARSMHDMRDMPVTPDAKDLEIAGLKAQLASSKNTEYPDDIEGVWALEESKTQKAIVKHEAEAIVDLEFEDNRPIAICFVSDQHLGAKYTDLKRMREDAELIGATEGLYAILGGDGVDNHILIRQAIIASETTPERQYELYEYYLSILGDSVIAMLTGNHDAWSGRMAGLDLVKRIADQHRITYRRHEALLKVRLGGQLYNVLCRHSTRYNSAINTLHGIKRQWDLGNYDFDIGVAGHIHSSAIEKFTRHRVDRWAAVAGAYQIISDYTSYGGFPDSKPTCPTFILYPDRRHIVGFDCVRDAVVHLEAVR